MIKINKTVGLFEFKKCYYWYDRYMIIILSSSIATAKHNGISFEAKKNYFGILEVTQKQQLSLKKG